MRTALLTRVGFFFLLLVAQTAIAPLEAYVAGIAGAAIATVPAFFSDIASPVGWIILPIVVGLLIGGALFVACTLIFVGLFAAFGIECSRMLRCPVPALSLNVVAYALAGGILGPVMGPYVLYGLTFGKTPFEINELIPPLFLIGACAAFGAVNAVGLSLGYAWNIRKQPRRPHPATPA